MTTETLTPEQMLRKRFAAWEYGDQWSAALDQALAAERRRTVDRIRAAYVSSDVPDGTEVFYQGIDAASAALFRVLDEEAAR